jgi:hypothetical protein
LRIFDLIEGADGEVLKKPVGMPKPERPVQKKKVAAPKKTIKSAADLNSIAAAKSANKDKELVQEILYTVLSSCEKAANNGLMSAEHLIEQGTDIHKGSLIKKAIREMKELGYSVTKQPEPGKGVWIKVAWKKPRAGNLR